MEPEIIASGVHLTIPWGPLQYKFCSNKAILYIFTGFLLLLKCIMILVLLLRRLWREFCPYFYQLSEPLHSCSLCLQAVGEYIPILYRPLYIRLYTELYSCLKGCTDQYIGKWICLLAAWQRTGFVQKHIAEVTSDSSDWSGAKSHQ